MRARVGTTARDPVLIRVLRGGVPVAVLVALVIAGPSAAASRPVHTATASLGNWQAQLTYTLSGPSYAREVGGLQLRVTHAGRLVSKGGVPLPKDCRDYPCSRLPPDVSGFLEVSDLDLASGPVATIWLWTGGAHCCTIVRFVTLADGRMAERNFGNRGAVVTTLDGDRVIRSADDRFAYLFTSYAASGLPVQVWRFSGQGLVDVTRDHRATLRGDAGGWWRAYRQQRRLREGETRGVFAAWAADVCRLGQRAKVEAAIDDGLARGDFSGPAASDPLGPHGAGYAKQLRQRLSAWRYCR